MSRICSLPTLNDNILHMSQKNMEYENVGDFLTDIFSTLNKCKELADNDNLVVAPCSIGDTLYTPGYDKNGQPCALEYVLINFEITKSVSGENVPVMVLERKQNGKSIVKRVGLSQFEKTVFAKKSQAKKVFQKK